MRIKFPYKITYFLKFFLSLVLLFQWTIPAMEKKKNVHINFSDITFEKCNNPDHSHPPLSQKNNAYELEILINSDINNSLITNDFQKYIYFARVTIFEKLERYPESLFRHFPPSRSPPFLGV